MTNEVMVLLEALDEYYKSSQDMRKKNSNSSKFLYTKRNTSGIYIYCTKLRSCVRLNQTRNNQYRNNQSVGEN